MELLQYVRGAGSQVKHGKLVGFIVADDRGNVGSEIPKRLRDFLQLTDAEYMERYQIYGQCGDSTWRNTEEYHLIIEADNALALQKGEQNTIDPALQSAVESIREAHEADQNATFTWDEVGALLAVIEQLQSASR